MGLGQGPLDKPPLRRALSAGDVAYIFVTASSGTTSMRGVWE